MKGGGNLTKQASIRSSSARATPENASPPTISTILLVRADGVIFILLTNNVVS